MKDEAFKTIQNYLWDMSQKERAELAVFLNDIMLPKEKRREVIRKSLGFKE